MLNDNKVPYSEDEDDIIAKNEECKECSNVLDSCGYCIDLDCPYNEHQQHEELDEE